MRSEIHDLHGCVPTCTYMNIYFYVLGDVSFLSLFLLGEEGIARSVIFSLFELGYLSDSWVSPGRLSRAVPIVDVEVRMDGCKEEILGQSLIPYIVFTFKLLCFALL